MKHTIILDSAQHVAIDVHDDHAVVTRHVCPHCGVEPFRVAGHGRRIASDDRAYEADASCLACGKHVGMLRVEVDTLFGVREDEVVSRMGVRVY